MAKFGAKVVLLALAIALVWPASAHAVIAGPCTAEINGVDLSGLNPTDKAQAIVVEKNSTVDYSGESLLPPTLLKIDLEFLGLVRWTVSRKRLRGDRTWSSVTQVNDYARFGVGLYQIDGRAIGPRPCFASALIRVKGNPLTTAGGIAGVASGVLGILGLTLGTARAARISGIIGGLLTGFGVAVLLQQYAIIYPTKAISIALLVAGAGVGIILPSLSRMSGARKANN